MKRRSLALSLATLAALVASAGCPAPVTNAPDAGSAPVVVDAGDAPRSTAASTEGRKLLPITKDGIGPMGAGDVTRGLVARIFLDGVPGTIEERNEVGAGEVVGRAYTVRRGEGVDAVIEAIVHADTGGRLYSVEIVAPIAEVRGVKVGDLLGKALGEEPVKCARGAEEREDAVFCAKKSEPQILYTTKPDDLEGPVAPQKLRALPITAIVWNPHAT